MKEITDLVKANGSTQAALRSIFQADDLTFKVIDDARLRELAAGMPEIHRATQSFAKHNSQAMGLLMTLQMLNEGPYRVLRQILAQLQQKRSALREAYYGLKEKEIEVKQLREKASEDPLERELCELKAQRLEGQAADSKDAIEACLKEIGMYVEAYNQVKESFGIRDNWDEADFEKAEVAHHIRAAFRLAVRDMIQTNRLNMGTMEYFEQWGINPIQGLREVEAYFKQFANGRKVTMEDSFTFLDAMAEKYKDAWKVSAMRLGLKQATFEKWLYTEGIV